VCVVEQWTTIKSASVERSRCCALTSLGDEKQKAVCLSTAFPASITKDRNLKP
jgi:hypothetical protein